MTDSGLSRSVYAPMPAAEPWRLEEVLSPARAAYCRYGRQALARALVLAGATNGRAVLLPGFVCSEVAAAAERAGARVFYHPVDEALRPAGGLARAPSAAAVVAVNYFGFPQDLDPYRAYCERTGAVLIEDNAHGLFGRDASGAWLGARGDLGVLSLRKTLPLPGGAALVYPSHGRFAPEPGAGFDPSLPASYRLKRMLRCSVSLLGPGPLRRLLRLKRAVLRDDSGPSGWPPDERAPALLAGPSRLPGPKEELARRRELYAWAGGLATAAGGRPVFETLPEGVCPYAYPFRAGPAELGRVRKALSREGLDCHPWPRLPDAVADMAPGHYKDVWCARFLW